MDPTESIRRQMIADGVNPTPTEKTWTTDEMQAEFDVTGFSAPVVVVTRKATGEVGSLMFRHNPRVYFGWKAHN
jgi:hypothetical protein